MMYKSCVVENCSFYYRKGKYCDIHRLRLKRFNCLEPVFPPRKHTDKDYSYKSYNPLYSSYRSMKDRCFNPNCKAYKNYGGRGITVCNRWLGKDGFKNFYKDMGKRPKGFTLDRRNNDLGYSPSNCRWATWIEQNNNRRPRSI